MDTGFQGPRAAEEAQFQLLMAVPTVPPPVLAEAAGYAQAFIVPDLTQLWPKDSGRTLYRDLPVDGPVVGLLSLQTPAGLYSHSASKFSL